MSFTAVPVRLSTLDPDFEAQFAARLHWAADTDAAIATAVAAVRPGGRVALAGIPSQDASSFPAAAARRKGLTFAMVRRMKDTYPRAIALAVAGVDLDALVTERHGLGEAASAFDAAARRRGDKVVVAVSDG